MRCWYARWQMSNALDRGDLASRMDRGHAAGCASCQAFGDALASLHARLSGGAHAAAVPVFVARRARWPFLVAGPMAVGAAVAIAIAAGTGGGHVEPAADVPMAASVAAPDSLVRVSRIAARVSQAFANTPLEAELDNLIHDGRRGLEAVLATGGLRWPSPQDGEN
jgi:hypothetical protein